MASKCRSELSSALNLSYVWPKSMLYKLKLEKNLFMFKILFYGKRYSAIEHAHSKDATSHIKSISCYLVKTSGLMPSEMELHHTWASQPAAWLRNMFLDKTLISSFHAETLHPAPPIYREQWKLIGLDHSGQYSLSTGIVRVFISSICKLLGMQQSTAWLFLKMKHIDKAKCCCRFILSSLKVAIDNTSDTESYGWVFQSIVAKSVSRICCSRF